LSPPKKCGKKKLQQFHDLVLIGDQVNPAFLKKHIDNAEILAFGWIGTELAGIAALKNPVGHHKDQVFESAGVPGDGNQYTYELGYIVTNEQFRNQGISKSLITALIDEYTGAWFYATTKNNYMRDLLPRMGLQKCGVSYANANGETIDLFVYNK
jgi:predicted GNAT family N-acyltransferase